MRREAVAVEVVVEEEEGVRFIVMLRRRRNERGSQIQKGESVAGEQRRWDELMELHSKRVGNGTKGSNFLHQSKGLKRMRGNESQRSSRGRDGTAMKAHLCREHEIALPLQRVHRSHNIRDRIHQRQEVRLDRSRRRASGPSCWRTLLRRRRERLLMLLRPRRTSGRRRRRISEELSVLRRKPMQVEEGLLLTWDGSGRGWSRSGWSAHPLSLRRSC